MGQSRLDLQDLLEEITEHVYFQPPTNTVIQYPCIVYKRENDDAAWADNKLYRHKIRYGVTLITRNPDDVLWYGVLYLEFCSFDRHFTAEGLNHDVFNLFF